MVAPSPAPLMRQIHGALIRAHGLIVMIRHRAMCGRSAKIRRYHPEHIDPVTQLQQHGHSEPTSAQPQVRALPVNSCFFFEQLVNLEHLVSRYDVDLEPGHHLLQQSQVVVNMASAVSSHEATRTPEYENSIVAGVEQLLSVPKHPLQAGVSDYTYTGPFAHIFLEAETGGIIHSDNTFRLVNFFASPAST